jgi:hypothetical protein
MKVQHRVTHFRYFYYKIKTNLDEAVQYLDIELKDDTQNIKKTRRFWLKILTKINTYL